MHSAVTRQVRQERAGETHQGRSGAQVQHVGMTPGKTLFKIRKIRISELRLKARK